MKQLAEYINDHTKVELASAGGDIRNIGDPLGP